MIFGGCIFLNLGVQVTLCLLACQVKVSRLRSLLMCPCDVFREQVNSLCSLVPEVNIHDAFLHSSRASRQRSLVHSRCRSFTVAIARPQSISLVQSILLVCSRHRLQSLSLVHSRHHSSTIATARPQSLLLVHGRHRLQSLSLVHSRYPRPQSL